MVQAAARASASAPSKRRLAPPPIKESPSSVDRLLGACGVMMACSSLAFAGYMLADNDHAPRIAGMQYLAVFARPSHSLARAGAPREPAAPPADEQREAAVAGEPAMPAIDPTPTGSIGAAAALGRPVNLILTPLRAAVPPSKPSRYAVLDVSNGVALIANEAGGRRVSAGDVVPGLGRVTAIERRRARWVLLVENGPPLDWPPDGPLAGAPLESKRATPPF